MPKVKVKKSSGDISITIENNLKANQITGQTVKRRKKRNTKIIKHRQLDILCLKIL